MSYLGEYQPCSDTWLYTCAGKSYRCPIVFAA